MPIQTSGMGMDDRYLTARARRWGLVIQAWPLKRLPAKNEVHQALAKGVLLLCPMRRRRGR